ncbi:hypothetical protein WJX72_001983 [[Myrmecia] bisecta]|uniref:Integral membrane protein n=1 Tax=[Myrmecia] bisecta TaxID=41462 RepID=A0AAW1R644_9CHLO
MVHPLDVESQNGQGHTVDCASKVHSPAAGSDYEHEWEHAIFQDRKHHPHLRKHASLDGFLWHHDRPRFITKAEGVDEKSRAFSWEARRHRKQRRQLHQPKHPKQTSWLHWFRFLKFWLYLREPQTAVSWLQGFFFFWGGMLFIASSIGPIIRSVDEGPHTRWSAWAWTAGYCSISGTDFFFLPGVYMTLVEAGNSDYKLRLHRWAKAGRPGSRPAYRWFFPFKADNLISWVSWLMLIGKLFFSTAFTLYALDPTIPINMTVVEQRVFIWAFGTFGSLCFCVFGLVQCWESSHSLWKGLVPLPSNCNKLGFWASASGFYGGVGFMIGSIWFLVIFDKEVSWGQNVVANCVGYLNGSFWFTLNGLLMWFEISDRPPPDDETTLSEDSSRLQT